MVCPFWNVVGWFLSHASQARLAGLLRVFAGLPGRCDRLDASAAGGVTLPGAGRESRFSMKQWSDVFKKFPKHSKTLKSLKEKRQSWLVSCNI